MRHRILGKLCGLIWLWAVDFVRGVTRGYAVRHDPRLMTGDPDSQHLCWGQWQKYWDKIFRMYIDGKEEESRRKRPDGAGIPLQQQSGEGTGVSNLNQAVLPVHGP